ncbi:MAG TPA: hypothetical protein VIU63_11325 [Nitrospira sp.]
MITDIFVKRYSAPLLGSSMPVGIATLLRQLAHIAIFDLLHVFKEREKFCQTVHQQLTRELGSFSLATAPSYKEQCAMYLAETYDMWNDAHGNPDLFLKTRLILVELMFREADLRISVLEHTDKKLGGLLIWSSGRHSKEVTGEIDLRERSVFNKAVGEMNARFRVANTGLHYHSGLIQLSDNDLTSERIAEPFWLLVSGEEWKNVEVDMKEAIDRHDSRGRDSPLYALKALESAIKIVSDKKGWTRGTEKGAASYIDNLVSRENGRFLEVWEADAIKSLFTAVRNPHGHGPGNKEMPAFPLHQQAWVIESAMSWIKSIVHRL